MLEEQSNKSDWSQREIGAFGHETVPKVNIYQAVLRLMSLELRKR